MSSHHDLSPAMQERYGIQPSGNRKLLYVLSLLVAFFVATYLWRITQSPVTGQLQRFTVTSERSVQISFSVTRHQPGKSYCVLRAQDRNKTDVGYATLTFPAGAERFDYTYILATESRAVLAEVLGCSNSLPVRVPPPNFPPGVVIPAQKPPGVAPKAQ